MLRELYEFIKKQLVNKTNRLFTNETLFYLATMFLRLSNTLKYNSASTKQNLLFWKNILTSNVFLLFYKITPVTRFDGFCKLFLKQASKNVYCVNTQKHMVTRVICLAM